MINIVWQFVCCALTLDHSSLVAVYSQKYESNCNFVANAIKSSIELVDFL